LSHLGLVGSPIFVSGHTAGIPLVAEEFFLKDAAQNGYGRISAS
jgi:hypothetical protein